jgi:hypothetical protein
LFLNITPVASISGRKDKSAALINVVSLLVGGFTGTGLTLSLQLKIIRNKTG